MGMMIDLLERNTIYFKNIIELKILLLQGFDILI